MKTQNEELLIKALCGYLPYGVTLHNLLKDYDAKLAEVNWLRNSVGVTGTEKGSSSIMTDSPLGFYKGAKYVQQWLPYLRPMSSMTEKEMEEYKGTFVELPNEEYLVRTIRTIDWLNAHRFDYRGLIDKGLALTAPEGMYDTKSKSGSHKYFPSEFGSYEEYAEYLKKNNYALDAPKGMYNF